MGLSWLWLRLWWVTAVTAGAVVTWWILFLLLVPQAWKRGVEAGERSL